MLARVRGRVAFGARQPACIRNVAAPAASSSLASRAGKRFARQGSLVGAPSLRSRPWRAAPDLLPRTREWSPVRHLGSEAGTPRTEGETPRPSAKGEGEAAAERKKAREDFLRRWNWLLRLLGYYDREAKNIRSGQALFRSCEAQSALVSRDASFGLELDWDSNKDFNTRQQLLLLHVWMVHRRLLLPCTDGKDVQEALFDALWEHTTRRIRSTGVHELTVNKHLTNVQKVCFTAAVSYDHGLNKVDDDNLELGSAIWRNVYNSDPKTPDECVYNMADYVRKQVGALEGLEKERLFDGELNWLDIDVDDDESPLQLGEWRQAIAASGRVYWWNIYTRESRWTKPPAPRA